MSSSDNFAQLQKLLKLKTYEQPPPRYFLDFSSKVMDRLRPGESTQAISWWEQLGFARGLKPILACGGGIAACGLLLYAVAFSLLRDPELAPPVTVGESAGLSFAMPNVMEPSSPLLSSSHMLGPSSSTNPILEAEHSTIPGLRLQVTPVSFEPSR